VIAHECVHVMETLSGQIIIKGFDAKRSFEHPGVKELFKKFIDEMGTDEFKRRYLTAD